MEVYLEAFVNFEQNDWARFLPIAELVYNNVKKASINHMHFELNRSYHSWMSYKEKVNSRSKSKSADKLLAELRELMIVCQKNLYYT